MSEIFIIDEWLWCDLEGLNSSQKQKETFNFLKALYKKCDKISVAKGSPFQKKENYFSKNATDNVKRSIARFYWICIRQNSEKYIELDIESIQAEVDLQGIKSDDHYLVKTYYKNNKNATIITTDKPLLNILKSKNITCSLRDDFLQRYLSEI